MNFPTCTQPYAASGSYVTWVTSTQTLADGAATTTQAEAIHNQVYTQDNTVLTQQVAIFNHTVWANGIGTVHVMTTTPVSSCLGGATSWPKSYDGPIATAVSTDAADTSTATASNAALASTPPMTSTLSFFSPHLTSLTSSSSIAGLVSCPSISSANTPAGHVTASSAAGIGIGCALAGALIPALTACMLRKHFQLKRKGKRMFGEIEDAGLGAVGRLAKQTSRIAAAPLQGDRL